MPYGKFPNWFKPKADPLRFEQSDLLKCIAPRALFVSSAEDDRYQPTTMANATANVAEDAWRVFGGATGPWKRIMEKGLPNAGKITVSRTSGAVYDIIAHKRIHCAARQGKTEIPVSFETTGGKVFLLADKALSPLAVRVRPMMGAYEVEVVSPDRDVLVPIEVVPTGGKSLYGVVKDGGWRRTIPATRVRAGGGFEVRNLADGSTARARP